MKLLLDTTYFLPAIGIAVKNLPANAPIKLMQKGHQIFISKITLFELSAKGAKYAALGKIAPERITRGIRAIAYAETINTIEIHESTILNTAFQIRKTLNDFIDCLILSSAINQCDTLITEDTDIQNIKEDKTFQEITAIKNPKFQIHKLAEIL
ncbi:PIN domain-containing protein [Candidatus Bathyarchaeota archaeon]|nr:PIN domain-containing protein [Candidatus Bathyarchaeota archaeon]MBS7618582.1 PIN domain-containing protein [Candidatus Bathyarchaeota archaeon]